MSGPTKDELQKMIRDQQTKEMLEKMQMGFSVKLGNVFISVLQQFSPNIHVGMHALTNTLTTTAARNKISKEKLLELVGQQYDTNAAAMEKALAGEATPEDPQPATVDQETGAAEPLVKAVTH